METMETSSGTRGGDQGRGGLRSSDSLDLGSDLRPALRSHCLFLVTELWRSEGEGHRGTGRQSQDGDAESSRGGLLERGGPSLHPVGDVISPLSTSWNTESGHGGEGELS